MQADPLYQCWKHICEEAGEPGPYHLLISRRQDLPPGGCRRLKDGYQRLILVCGHYEGIDERFVEECVDEEISLGDFVLTGGEIPAMAVADAVCRLVPGCCPTRSAMRTRATGTVHWRRPSIPGRRCGTRERCPPSSCQATTPRWTSGGGSSPSCVPARRRPDLYERLDLSSKADQKILKELRAEEPGAVPGGLTRAAGGIWSSTLPQAPVFCGGADPFRPM